MSGVRPEEEAEVQQQDIIYVWAACEDSEMQEQDCKCHGCSKRSKHWHKWKLHQIPAGCQYGS